MNLTKTTSCTATNESFYCSPYSNDIKTIVTKHTDSGKIKNYFYMNRSGKCTKIRMELFPHIKGHKKQFKNKQSQ
jgi:hypothetical protein